MENMQKQFDLFNDLIFDNAVPYCEIAFERKLKKNAMGYFHGDFDENGNKTYLIEVSLAYDNTAITLIHEMVHALQYKLDKPVNHKKYFKQWKNWIKYEFGLDI